MNIDTLQPHTHSKIFLALNAMDDYTKLLNDHGCSIFSWFWRMRSISWRPLIDKMVNHFTRKSNRKAIQWLSRLDSITQVSYAFFRDKIGFENFTVRATYIHLLTYRDYYLTKPGNQISFLFPMRLQLWFLAVLRSSSTFQKVQLNLSVLTFCP